MHLICGSYLFLPEGTFAFRSDIVTLSNHHKVLIPLLLLVAGAGVWVQLGPLLDKLLPIGATRLMKATEKCVNYPKKAFKFR